MCGAAGSSVVQLFLFRKFSIFFKKPSCFCRFMAQFPLLFGYPNHYITQMAIR